MKLPAICFLVFLAQISVLESSFGSAKRIQYRNSSYDIFIIKPPFKDLKLHWRNQDDMNFSNFQSLKDHLKSKKRKLLFATNAGIFELGFTPLGLHIENFTIKRNINRKKGKGNFYTNPNGVFFITRNGKAEILQTNHYFPKPKSIRLASQSGPMLVFKNRIHWLFKKKASSKFIRNGVGINKQGHIVFAISNTPVNFYDFAALFRFKLACSKALYLDGSISKMYLPALKRNQLGGLFTGIFSYSIKN